MEWKERAKQFHGFVENVSEMFIRLSDTPNRAVLYDLYPYIWDVKEVVLLLDSFVNWLGKLYFSHGRRRRGGKSYRDTIRFCRFKDEETKRQVIYPRRSGTLGDTGRNLW